MIVIRLILNLTDPAAQRGTYREQKLARIQPRISCEAAAKAFSLPS